MAALFIIILTVFFVQGYTYDLYEYEQVNYERYDGLYGTILSIAHRELFDTLEACNVMYPDSRSFEVFPEDKSPHPNVSFVGVGSLFTVCGVTLLPVAKDLAGIWQLTSVNRRWSNNTQYIMIQKFNLTVIDLPWRKNSFTKSNTEILNTNVYKDEIGTKREVKIQPKSLLDRLKRCSVITPKGTTIELFPNEDQSTSNIRFSKKDITQAKCGVVIDPIDEESRGEWRLVWESDHTIVQPFVEATPDLSEESDEDSDTIVVHTTTTGGSVHVLLDTALDLNKVLECFVQDPHGNVFQIYPNPNTNTTESLHPMEQTLINSICGVIIDPVDLEHTGTWHIYRKKDNVVDMEDTFLVAIEDTVQLIPNGNVNVFRGMNLYILFPLEFNDHDNSYNCEVISPENATYSIDLQYSNRCGIILNNITNYEGGLWTIYKNNHRLSKQIGEVTVVLNDDEPHDTETIYATIGEDIYLDFGPEDAIFCYISEPSGTIVERKHSEKCRYHIDAVDYTTFGSWKAEVGLEGSINTFSYTQIILPIEVAETKINVSIDNREQTIQLLCTMESDEPLKVCRFISPDGDTLIMNVGLGNANYRSIGQSSKKGENGYSLECGVEILIPGKNDLGSWLCILDTETRTKTAYLQLAVTENAAEQNQTKELTAIDHARKVVSGQPFKLMCQAQQSLDYCWFRSPNGTIFTVMPGIRSSDFDYYGEGLSYGHCGITVFAASPSDNGNWICNARTDEIFDSSDYFSVDFRATPLMAQDQYPVLDREMRLTCQTLNKQPLEYCRFVRPDKVGIHPQSEILPNTMPQYSAGFTNLSIGLCQLIISQTTSQDIGYWGCFAKPKDISEEYQDFFNIIDNRLYKSGFGKIMLWMCIMPFFVCLMCIILILSMRLRRKSFERTTTKSADIYQISTATLPHNNYVK